MENLYLKVEVKLKINRVAHSAQRLVSKEALYNKHQVKNTNYVTDGNFITVR